MVKLRRHTLVLSIYANTRGFAFILFEGRLAPFDWGIRESRGPRKYNVCLRRITRLLDLYEPDTLVIQDTSAKGTKRAGWISNLNSSIAALAKNRAVPVFAYSRDQVRNAFECYERPNKQSLAELIAKHIPAFEQYVPPPRRPWMSEDRRMGLFDAAALALTFFQTTDNQSG